MAKIALITGITGQDGSYLAELLLEKGYEVHGIIRRVASDNEEHRFWRIRKIKKDLQLHAASLESYASIAKVIQKIKPEEIYHLASQSFVGTSFEDEFSTFNANLHGTHYMLSAAKDFCDGTKLFKGIEFDWESIRVSLLMLKLCNSFVESLSKSSGSNT